MAKDTRKLSGRGEQYSSKLDAYNKESKKSAVGKAMRTFSRSKVSDMITTWDDANYFTVRNCYLGLLADATGAVDTLTVPSNQATNVFNLVWELFYTNANLKDLVADDETSWKLYVAVYLTIMAELQIQYNARCYLPAYTEADATPGGASGITYFQQESYDIFVASMAQYPMPKGCDSIVKDLFSWVIKLTESYDKYTIRIPSAIFQPFNTRYDLADLEAMRELLRVNLGGFTTHAKKYGLGVGSWHDPVKPVERKFGEPDITAFLCHSHYIWYDNTPAHAHAYPAGGFVGGNSTTDWTSVEYYFHSDPNESSLHVLAPLFGTYDATHNKYGGWLIDGAAVAAEYQVNFFSCAQHGTSMTNHSFIDKSSGAIIAVMKATSDGIATLKKYIDGTNFTAASELASNWAYSNYFGLFFGSGRGQTEAQNDMLNYIGRIMT